MGKREREDEDEISVGWAKADLCNDSHSLLSCDVRSVFQVLRMDGWIVQAWGNEALAGVREG